MTKIVENVHFNFDNESPPYRGGPDESHNHTSRPSPLWVVLLQIWSFFKGLVFPEDNEKWTAIFERKVLRGQVGIPLAWPQRAEGDFLWEVDAVIAGLAGDDQSYCGAARDDAHSQPGNDESRVYLRSSKTTKDQNRNMNFDSPKSSTRCQELEKNVKHEYTAKRNPGAFWNVWDEVTHRSPHFDLIDELNSGEKRNTSQSGYTSDIFKIPSILKKDCSIRRCRSEPNISSEIIDFQSSVPHSFQHDYGESIDDNFNYPFSERTLTELQHNSNSIADVKDSPPGGGTPPRTDKVAVSPTVSVAKSHSSCPIDQCEIQNCLLNEDDLDKAPVRVSIFQTVCSYIFRPFWALKSAINPEYEDPALHLPFYRNRIVGTDLTAVDKKGVHIESQKPKEDEGLTEEINNAFKFDIRLAQDTDEPLSTSIKRALGLDKMRLPKRPTMQEAEVKLSDEDLIPTNRLCFPKTVQAPTPVKGVSFDDTYIVESGGSYHKRKFLKGRDGLRYYNLLAQVESILHFKNLTRERDSALALLKWKHDTLLDIVKIARDYYSKPSESNRARWKTLKSKISSKKSSNVDMAVVMSRLPDHYPIFSVGLIAWQVCTMIVLTAYFGFAYTGVESITGIKSDVLTFLGTETYFHFTEPNPWLGPSNWAFILAGGTLLPCMQNSEFLKTETDKLGYQPLNKQTQDDFGCCERNGTHLVAGTTTESECIRMTMKLGYWRKGELCSQRRRSGNFILQLIRPCCVGLRGLCQMLSHGHCIFLDGIYHRDKDHCVQVNCLKHVCYTGNYVSSFYPDPEAPWRPSKFSAWQWWRLLFSLLHVHGFVQLIVVLAVEITVMMPLEMSVGWARTTVMYIISSVAGQMVGCAVQPGEPQEGGTPGATGMLAVATLEMVQAWPLLHGPPKEIAKLIILFGIFLVMGTFPLASISSAMTGYIVGLMTCLLAVPYISFGQFLSYWRYRLVLLAICLLVISFTAISYMFGDEYVFGICTKCFTLECVQYTPKLCKTSYLPMEGTSYSVR